MQRNEHATATKHENKIHGSDVHNMVNKTLALSDIKIIGIGVTVWKWQAFYETSRSASYSK